MSFFTKMFNDSTKSTAFLWLVNKQGEIAVVHVPNPTVDMSQPFCVANSWRRMVQEMLSNSDFVTPYVFSGSSSATWDEIADVLNGKPCAKKKDYEAVYYFLGRFNINIPIDSTYVKGKRKWKLAVSNDSKGDHL